MKNWLCMHLGGGIHIFWPTFLVCPLPLVAGLLYSPWCKWYIHFVVQECYLDPYFGNRLSFVCIYFFTYDLVSSCIHWHLKEVGFAWCWTHWLLFCLLLNMILYQTYLMFMLLYFVVTDTCDQQIAETIQRGITTYRQENWSYEWDLGCNGHSEVCNIRIKYSSLYYLKLAEFYWLLEMDQMLCMGE